MYIITLINETLLNVRVFIGGILGSYAPKLRLKWFHGW